MCSGSYYATDPKAKVRTVVRSQAENSNAGGHRELSHALTSNNAPVRTSA